MHDVASRDDQRGGIAGDTSNDHPAPAAHPRLHREDGPRSRLPPTVREIGEAVGLTSSSRVLAQLANLERKRMLHKDPTKPRAVALPKPRAAAVTLPPGS